MNGFVIWSLAAASVAIVGLIVYLLKNDKAREPAKERKENTLSKNGRVIDYNQYNMAAREKYLYLLLAGIVIFIIGYILYRNILLSLMVTPLALFYPSIKTGDIIKRQKEELNIQFKEALYALSSSISAGKSIEMAFSEALKDLSILYSNPDTYIIKELQYIIRKLDMNETVESALEEFARRAHVEDIENFVDVLKTCKRTGGNLVQVMKNTSDIINDKITIKQEITTILSQRKFEQKVLNFVPLGMIFLLSTSAEDFMKPIFTQIQGRIVMTVAAGLLVAAYFISKKIMDIEV